MRFSFNWLKEFADFPVDAVTLARDLTMVGIQLESLTPFEDDFTLNFEVTVNRPDCLSIVGLAREIAVLYGLPAPRLAGLHPAEVVRIEEDDGQLPGGETNLRIVLEDPDLCPRYCGQIVKGVRIGPSPAWIRRRLEACGLRSINNVVDISNLVMMELGQPMHAFDYDLLEEAEVHVRKAGAEFLVMIDGKERMLKDPMLLIADAHRAVAVAGVMGGQETEVTVKTRNLLLESAYFNPVSVRKTAKALEMSTDASYRFERGADPAIQMIACRRASALLKEYAGAEEIYPILDVCPGVFDSIKVPLRSERIQTILGEKIDASFVDGTLEALGFHKQPDGFWQAPSFRVDIFREIDLIEEVARHYGYNRLPSTLPKAEKKYQKDYATYDLEHSISQFLRSAGIDEAYTSSFVGISTTRGKQRIRILNPIAETAAEMRDSLIPGLLESVGHNLRHRNHDVRLFEIGRVFLPEGEKVALGIVLIGDYEEMKGLIEAALPALQYPRPSFTEGTIRLGETGIGVIAQHSVESQNVQTCELHITDLIRVPKTELRYEPIIPYPYVERDASFVLDEAVPYSKIEETLGLWKTLSVLNYSSVLHSYKLKDRYKGPNLPPGKISLTMQFIFQSPDRTLTSEEVDKEYSLIVKTVCSELKAELRQ